MCNMVSSVSNRGIDFGGSVVGMADVGTICELSSSGVDMVRCQKILQRFMSVLICVLYSIKSSKSRATLQVQIVQAQIVQVQIVQVQIVQVQIVQAQIVQVQIVQVQIVQAQIVQVQIVQAQIVQVQIVQVQIVQACCEAARIDFISAR